MIRSLWTAAAGMHGQQFNVDTIANNLANVNTGGFRKRRAEFEDLIYAHSGISGTASTPHTVRPLDISIGHGTRAAASQTIFSQGILRETENISDMALNGEGFFRVLLPDGSYGYTRDGAFKIDSNGQFVTAEGYRLEPEIILPEGFLKEDVKITSQGIVSIKMPPGTNNEVEVGRILLYRFSNPPGLKSIGNNIYKMTPASGEAMEGEPMQNGSAEILHKFLEYSNVNMANEMVNMIVAQRAYEFNSKAIQTSDNMLGTAVSLKR